MAQMRTSPSMYVRVDTRLTGKSFDDILDITAVSCGTSCCALAPIFRKCPTDTRRGVTNRSY